MNGILCTGHLVQKEQELFQKGTYRSTCQGSGCDVYGRNRDTIVTSFQTFLNRLLSIICCDTSSGCTCWYVNDLQNET